MAFSPDAKRLALALALTSGGGWTIQILDTKSGDIIVSLPMDSDTTAIMSVTFSPDGKLLASTGTDQTIRLWETQTWSARIPLKGQRVVPVSFLPDSKELVTGGPDGYVRLWKVDGGRQARGRFDLDPAFWPELAGSRRGGVAADNSSFFIVSPQGESILVDPYRGEIHPKATLPFKDSRRICVGRGAALVALGREKGLVTLWDTAKGQVVADFKLSKEQNVEAMTYSANGKWLAARGKDGAFSLWDVPARKEEEVWRDSLDHPFALLFSPNSNLLACGLRDGKILIWDVASHRQFGAMTGHKNGILLMDFSPDSKRLATTSYDGTGRVWDLEKFVNIATISGSKGVYFHPVLSPDASRVFFDEWGTASLFDIQSQRCVARLVTGYPKFLSPDIVLGLSQNQVWHWQPPSFAQIDQVELERQRSTLSE
jgi:WD40 repeat protein